MLLASGGAVAGITGALFLADSLLWLLHQAIDAPMNFGGGPNLTTLGFHEDFGRDRTAGKSHLKGNHPPTHKV
jgi:hypothetical protein